MYISIVFEWGCTITHPSQYQRRHPHWTSTSNWMLSYDSNTRSGCWFGRNNSCAYYRFHHRIIIIIINAVDHVIYPSLFLPSPTSQGLASSPSAGIAYEVTFSRWMILYLQRQLQHHRVVGCVVHMELLSISSVWFGNVQDVWMLLYPSIHQSFFATDSFYSKIWSTLVVQDLGRSYNPFIFVINKLYHHSTLSAILQVIVTIVSSNWQASNNNNVYQYQYWVLLRLFYK